MKTIHKYIFDPRDGHQNVDLPDEYEIVDVGKQGTQWFVWATVEHDSSPIRCIHSPVVMVGTGWNLDNSILKRYKHFKTIHTSPGFVWHVFILKGEF